MKQLIVLFSSILLGIAIYQMIADGGDGSIYGTVKQVWVEEIKRF